ncbi:hypothetical protein BCR34DRAFT_578029 [Clohesyomyces aquaticus]|uniref:Uncharacterized protein n=1 Tax=Clohesyomyces aquaticus TaxID=1231657 RepID=A0A1Y1YHA5_9PLEO|nr:hypothetical protein BCR34DRAFT_578029 [Clohesyomyces aquaticus]
MIHEHQRADRDDHFSFRCQNVKGFEEALAEVKEKKLGGASELCSDASVAAAVGFVGSAFFVQPPGVAKDSSTWDAESIMLYWAGSFAKDDCLKREKDDKTLCPLTYDENHGKAPEKEHLIPRAFQPSKMDVEFIRDIYGLDDSDEPERKSLVPLRG